MSRRATAVALLGGGVVAATVMLPLSSDPVAKAIGALVMTVVYGLVTWLGAQGRLEAGYEQATLVESSTSRDPRHSAVLGALSGLLTAVAGIAVVILLDRVGHGDGFAPFTIGLGIVLGSGFATALGARDLGLWQQRSGRIVLRPRDAPWSTWTIHGASTGLVAVPAVPAEG